MPTPESLLKKYWGFDTFRPLQREIIGSVIDGGDTLALLPTGGGKSLCYQIPALMADGMCLVVSPLIALMKDQVQQLNNRHIKAACITSGMSSQEVATILNNSIYGKIKFLYVSPERLRQRTFIEHMRRMRISLIAVDEAHCISQWGYDFRPPYLQIADIRPYHPQAPILALTATATPIVANDIVAQLHMRDAHIFRASFLRPNLAYKIAYCDDTTTQLLDIVRRTAGSGIVYTRSRRSTRQIADLLNAHDIPATYYHAGLNAYERDLRQGLWMQGKCRVIVATNAFGMGIDKPDVRFVLHLDIPDSLEAYFQEAGRAGRDGQAALCLLFASPAAIERMHSAFANEYPTLQYVRNVYRALCNHYRIPLGGGASTSHNFDLETLCHDYNLAPAQCYNACHLLEREGLISIPDRENASSTLLVTVDRDDLYRFQVDHFRLGNLLTETIRMYPGLFTVPTAISERKIASHCLLTAGEVRKALTELHEMRLVDYRYTPDAQQIVFACGRIDERSIFLNEQNYNSLKQTACQRLAAIEAYLNNRTDCRSHQLLAYFGETAPSDRCGICDTCLDQHPNATPPPLGTEARLLQLLKNSPLTVKQACQTMERENYHNVEQTIEHMLDHGALHLDKNLFLSIS